MNTSAALYRWFNKNDELLYIGISRSLGNRVREHSRTSTWFKESAYMTVQWVKKPEQLEAKEKFAIAKERPLYNRAGNPRPRRKSFVTPVTVREVRAFALLLYERHRVEQMTETIESLQKEIDRLEQKDKIYKFQAERAEFIWNQEKIQRTFIVCASERKH